MRNGPISQSAGIARTRKKTRISPAQNSRNPNRLRRRRSGSLRELGVRLNGAAATTGCAVAAVARTASCTGGFVSVGSGSIGAPAWVAAALAVSSCSLTLARLIGAAAATGCAVTAEVAGTASCTGGFVSLASRSCSFALSANEAGSCGCTARQGRRRICDPPYREPITALLSPSPRSHESASGW